MKRALPKHVHRKRSKGYTYLYFNTGRKNAAGKPVLVRLPDYNSNGFGRAYAACMEARENPTAVDDGLTVPQLCEKFRRSAHFGKKAKGTKESYLTYLKVIEEQLDTFLAAEVTPRDVLALHEKLSVRPAAANQTVRTLSALYAWAKGPYIALVNHNPAAGIDLYGGGEHEPWPDWLLEKALNAEDPFVRLVVSLLYYTGQRIGDVCAMPWRKVFDSHMEVKQQKTDDELEIVIHNSLRAVLKATPRTLGTIVAKPDGTPYSKAHVRARLQAWAKERGADVVPHGLRKNAVNGLLEAGCTIAEVNAVTGQSLQMIELYARKRDRKKLSGRAMRKWENI